MTNVEKLKKAGVIAQNAKLSQTQTDEINALSELEIFALKQVKKKVSRLAAMRFNAGGGIF